MHQDNYSYNPNLYCKDSITFFKGFILLQDEVPSGVFIKNEDSTFLKNRIIQVKAEKHEYIDKSFFASHLLRPSTIETKEKAIMNPGWIHGMIVICFLLFAIAQYGYFRRMQQIFKAFFANRLFNQLSRDGGLFSERVSLFLFISFILSFSLFIFKAYDFYFEIPAKGLYSFILYAKITAGVLLFYLLKMGLYNISGFIFKSIKETSDYILNIYIFGQVTGVLLLPLIVLITYINTGIVLYLGLIIISMAYIYRLFRGVMITVSNVKISAYYIFLYLCTLEILPLLLLTKILMTFIG